MVSERDRILDLVNYIESCGVEVNIARNKARGNKGFFRAENSKFRIDIAKDQKNIEIIRILAHEFAHFVHYTYDRTLKNLDFIFPDEEDVLEELLMITIDSISKKTVENMFREKDSIKKSSKEYVQMLKTFYPDFKEATDFIPLERKINKTSLRYLLKYDKVKVVELFGIKYYSVEDLSENTPEELYIKYKSNKRRLKRINSKISRLNKYYNSPTELFARSFELYVTNQNKLKELAPKVYKMYLENFTSLKVPLLINFVNKMM